MKNKLVVIIKSLKGPKIKKILLYEIKFLVPHYSCLQNPWLGGLPPPDPRSLCPLSSTEFVETPPNKIPGFITDRQPVWVCGSACFENPVAGKRICFGKLYYVCKQNLQSVTSWVCRKVKSGRRYIKTCFFFFFGNIRTEVASFIFLTPFIWYFIPNYFLYHVIFIGVSEIRSQNFVSKGHWILKFLLMFKNILSVMEQLYSSLFCVWCMKGGTQFEDRQFLWQNIGLYSSRGISG